MRGTGGASPLIGDPVIIRVALAMNDEMSAAVGKARKAPTGPARAPPASAEANACPPVRFIVSALILGLRHVFSITW